MRTLLNLLSACVFVGAFSFSSAHACSGKTYSDAHAANIALADLRICTTLSEIDIRRAVRAVLKEQSSALSYTLLAEFGSKLDSSERARALAIIHDDPERAYFSLTLENIRMSSREIKQWTETALYRIADAQLCFNVLLRTVNTLEDVNVYMLVFAIRLRGAPGQAAYLLKGLDTRPLTKDAREELVEMLEERNARKEARDVIGSKGFDVLEKKYADRLRKLASGI